MSSSRKKNTNTIKLLYIGEGNQYVKKFVDENPQFVLHEERNGWHAINYLKLRHVDIMVCDNKLMDISVVDFRNYLKKYFLLLGVPFVVFCSGEKEKKILESKCKQFYALCCYPQELKETIKKFNPDLKKTKKSIRSYR